MSGTELLAVFFGLFIGYWVVSQFGPGGKGKKEPPPVQAGPDPEVRRQREQAAAAAPASWHEVLNVPPHADLDEIRHAYKRLMSQYHPDKVASLGPELRELCERKTKEINTAYDRALAERGAA